MRERICPGRASEIGGVDSPSKMRTGTLDGVEILKADLVAEAWKTRAGFFDIRIQPSHSEDLDPQPCWTGDGSNAVVVLETLRLQRQNSTRGRGANATRGAALG